MQKRKRWLLLVGVELGPKRTTPGAISCMSAFDQKVEEKLVQPTFITMHPVDVSPLWRSGSPKDPRLTERFWLFICRSEMGNITFSELNDPIDQKARFQKQVEMREHGDEEAGGWIRTISQPWNMVCPPQVA